ncbi:Thiopurine S-methyltransferase [Metarhizium rileyi]|uniref:Thiopurine S-methyltransferase n=1 Tax=Metarhizium rileyi (strain RCEF 4871) TaxID=1649241 RepID=A0A167DBZ4_METRR|nr:Thiopurine S-methyltransferase [Metarhizium rileyi RCEF 4871]TWU72511.1 hypothetical protein ED733_002703 [Metarhizium rileyi]
MATAADRRDDEPLDALADLLSQRADLVPPAQHLDAVRPTALVPSCTRVHDVLLLSSLGYNVVALAADPGALRQAEETTAKASADKRFAPTGAWESGNINWLVGDFFSEDELKGLGTAGSGTFDLIYDNAFLSTIPPNLRPRWASRMAQLLRPSGRLVCLESPSRKPLSEQGAPWGLRPEIYEALLSAPGKDVAYNSDGSLVETTAAKPDANALHRLSIIRPQRTPGDFISVWAP